MNTSLIGNWKLTGDTNDSPGNGNHGQNQGVDLTAPGPDQQPNFDGQQSYILVPSSSSLQIDTNDFSISARIFTEERLDDPIGDIVAKFDADRRNSFNLGLKRHSGSGTSLANYRNVHFGIDDGHLAPEWTDCGQLGNAVFVISLAVHQGHLYGGTEWEDPGSRDNSGNGMVNFD